VRRQGRSVTAERLADAELLEGQWAEAEDLAAQTVDRLAERATGVGQLGAAAVNVDRQGALADLKVEGDVGEGLRRLVVEGVGQGAAVGLALVDQPARLDLFIGDAGTGGRGGGGRVLLPVSLSPCLRVQS
jgi:hypothetical protein